MNTAEPPTTSVLSSSNNKTSDSPSLDPEKQAIDPSATKVSAFKSLGLLDQFLALWIFLAMAVGIILGNFVPSTGPTLQKGKFVGVSVPIGMFVRPFLGRSLGEGRGVKLREGVKGG